MCHMCKCHVIPYLFVYSVPSWGPHAGCRQMHSSWQVIFSCTVCTYCGTVCLQAINRKKEKHVCSLAGVFLSLITTLWCKVQDLSLLQFLKCVNNFLIIVITGFTLCFSFNHVFYKKQHEVQTSSEVVKHHKRGWKDKNTPTNEKRCEKH